MASEARESPANNPGLSTNRDEATKGYIMQQTVRFLCLYLRFGWSWPVISVSKSEVICLGVL